MFRLNCQTSTVLQSKRPLRLLAAAPARTAKQNKRDIPVPAVNTSTYESYPRADTKKKLSHRRLQTVTLLRATGKERFVDPYIIRTCRPPRHCKARTALAISPSLGPFLLWSLNA